MSEETVNPTPENVTTDERLDLDRRTFLAGAAAAGLVVGTGLVACDGGEAKAVPSTPETKAEPKAEEKKAEAKKADDKAAAEEKQPKAEPKAEEKKAEPVAETFPFKKDGFIAQVTHAGATEKIKKTNEDIVKQMVDESLKRLTGAADGKTAMAKFIKADDVVGIKINALGSPYAAVHPSTAFALAELVHAVGVPKEKITIYDQYGSRMRKAGFQVMPKGAKAKPGKVNVHNHETMGYTKERHDLGGFNKNNKKPYKSQLPKVVETFTAVINVCVPKDHDLTGVTGALKNVSYGNVERVPIYHCRPECNPKCQFGKCNVSNIYKHEKMGGLVRLVVCDALRVLFNGGPQDNMTFKAAHNAILASTDPVSIDRAIHVMVNEYRATRKLKPIEEDQGGRRAPRFIEDAEALGLGVADIKKIKWDKHSMG